jgi:hypothetical protein
VAFSGDGVRLYDIRDTKTKIWEPAVLVRNSIDDQSSLRESISPPASMLDQNQDVDIMAIDATSDAGCIFAGMDNGSVVAYDWETGEKMSTLYSHRPYAFVYSVSWNHSMIATSDVSNTIQVHSVNRSPHGIWSSAGKEFEKQVSDGNGTIQQLLLHPTKAWLLVFQPRHTMKVDIKTGEDIPYQHGWESVTAPGHGFAQHRF